VPLTVPDSDALLLHMRRTEPFSAVEEDWVDDVLQRASDLMEVASDVHEDPDDGLGSRLLTVGVLAMAHALFSTGGTDREALYSPFSSERLGSYSYSKASAAVSTGVDTGVPEFDQAVTYFGALVGTDGDSIQFAVTSEVVFPQPMPVEEARALTLSLDALGTSFP